MTCRRRQAGEEFEGMEIVHDGWLVKSPPEKRILKAKWRQRWFVLRSSGQLPGQFVLEYYTDTTRRKLKGKIDLDQCEQVDAGLTFESRKSNYQHMFDIRTPKRVYYLVAETESDMNKWVDCICSVCGLKIEEDYLHPPESTPSLPVPPTSSPPEQSSGMELLRSGSNPYISISECISGKPIANGFANGRGSCSESLPEEAPPPPPKLGNLDKSSNDFYDYPKPLNFLNDKDRTSPEPNIEELYKIPPPVKNANRVLHDDDSLLPPLPPKVNWDTYPQDCSQSKNEAESQSKDINCLVTKNYGFDDSCKATETLANQLEHTSINDLSSAEVYMPPQESNHRSENNDHFQSSASVDATKPPPRPPKPHNLGRKYENVVLATTSDNSSTLCDKSSGKGVALSKYLPAEVFSFLKDETDLESLSPSTKVPPQLPKSSKNVPLDDIYDFPKLICEDNINISVPPPLNGTGSQRRKRHAYTNAPPGLFSNKDTIFNYEFVRPSLLSGDGYLSMDSQKNELYTDMTSDARLSPSSLGTYANVPASPSLALGPATDIPPAVNRELKPKRKISEGDTAQNDVLALAPPPVSRFRPRTTKRSFRKPSRPQTSERANANTPPLPGRSHQRSEHSASDDDVASSGGSRRNSVNSEQEMKQMIPPAPHMKKEEIQYLDLDLDSDASVQSPRSPERLSSASIVYKKIDFVKTKAFNEMRQNVEETYRKSQKRKDKSDII